MMSQVYRKETNALMEISMLEAERLKLPFLPLKIMCLLKQGEHGAEREILYLPKSKLTLH